jgi:tRNA-dihydrouridine synthase
VTDPIFSGKLIYGNKNYLEQIQRQIQNQPITQEAITHHISEIERLKKYQTNIDHEEKSRKKYIESFSQNLEQLRLGNKPLTLKNLKQLYEE